MQTQGRDPETYKRKFQEVSEAYATLGSEKGRREYDRRLSSGYSSPGSSQDPSAGSYGYHYDGTRMLPARARATYAWEYQKKRSDTPRARRSNYHRDSSSSSNPNSRSSFGSGLGAGSSPPKGSAADIFSQLAERERKREAARNATANANGSRTTTTPIVDADETGASPIWRFIQVASVFTIVLWIGNKVSGGESQRRERRLIRNQDRLDWKDGSISKLGGELEVEVRKSL